uniref:Uncharacterized protein n=1 Tax=Amphora coffeiformis TaxID=265554 RepID=A0A7S3LC48_9STRA|mmetsp:Transcript_17466/g.33181  ORF Transcript_17466/g.33181 Transcript_17466/m.33181 type:complete len:152 (+) Transcript_17466:13-468(+)
MYHNTCACFASLSNQPQQSTIHSVTQQATTTSIKHQATMEEASLTSSHYICNTCGFGRDQRKTDESILNHVRSCHGVDIISSKKAPFFECHNDDQHHRLVNMQAVQEHLQTQHGVYLEKHYFDTQHHEIDPPVLTRVDAEAPCEASASLSS